MPLLCTIGKLDGSAVLSHLAVRRTRRKLCKNNHTIESSRKIALTYEIVNSGVSLLKLLDLSVTLVVTSIIF